MAATTAVKSLTVNANSTLGVLNALGFVVPPMVCQLHIYVPDEPNLALGDSTHPTDPAATMPMQSNPFVVDSIKITTLATDDILVVNNSAKAVVFIAHGWVRQLLGAP